MSDPEEKYVIGADGNYFEVLMHGERIAGFTTYDKAKQFRELKVYREGRS